MNIKKKADKITCDITVLNGTEDLISLKGIIGWKKAYLWKF